MKRFYLIIFVIGYTYSQNYSYITPTRDGIGKVYMGREISKVMGHMGAPWLERSTREFEERFLKIGMPYRIIGGTKFYERAEIKDCIAYLRIVNQSRDDLSFERIINVNG